MPGIRLPIVPKESYNFANLPINQTQDIILLKALPVSNYREATLLVRVHSYTIAQNDANYIVKVSSTDVAPDDPFNEYWSSQLPAASVTVNNTLLQQTLLTSAITTPFAPFLRIYLRATMGAIASSLTATLSVDFSLKE